MSDVIFIGDELSAAGYRLAGAVTRTPADDEAVSALEWARQQAPLVLITAELAARIPHPVLAHALAAPAPLVLVVPDIWQRVTPPDLAAAVRRDLGMETGR